MKKHFNFLGESESLHCFLAKLDWLAYFDVQIKGDLIEWGIFGQEAGFAWLKKHVFIWVKVLKVFKRCLLTILDNLSKIYQ